MEAIWLYDYFSNNKYFFFKGKDLQVLATVAFKLAISKQTPSGRLNFNARYAAQWPTGAVEQMTGIQLLIYT